MQVRFVFKSTSGKPPRTHSRGLPVIVGRSDAEEIRLRIAKDSVSRRHCELFRDEEAGHVCIRDLESTNGTFVDGRQLKPRVATPVSSGAVVKVGNVTFIVEYQVGPVGRSAHDSDTIPIDEATAAGELEDLEPVGPEPAAGVALTEPVDATEQLDAAVAEDDTTEPAAEIVAAEPAAEGDFNFLAAAADDPAPAADAWPTGDDAPAAKDDASLDDFLKGLP
jgi:predicted component of type VI protein secretion system